MREFRDKLPTKELKDEFERDIYMNTPVIALTIQVKEREDDKDKGGDNNKQQK